MNSHFVSKVILKNFANPDKKIKVFDKQSGLFSFENIQDVCNLELCDDLFSEAERKWDQRIETKIGNLLIKYKGDFLRIWSDESNHPALRRLLALHFVRSFVFITKLQDTLEVSTRELVESVPIHLCEIVAKQFINNVATSTPEMMNDLYNKTKSELDKFQVEIAEASAGENFVIGDAPILNNRRAVLDSEFFAMPVTPKFMISMTREKRFLKLSTKATRKIKRMSKRESINYWLCLPEG